MSHDEKVSAFKAVTHTQIQHLWNSRAVLEASDGIVEAQNRRTEIWQAA